METALASASAIADHTEKINSYNTILATVIDSDDVQNANTFLNHVLSDDHVPLEVAQSVMSNFSEEFDRFSAGARKAIADLVLAQFQFQPPDVFLKHYISVIRVKGAELYASEGEWPKAAQMLRSIDFLLDPAASLGDKKLQQYIQISNLHFKADDIAKAELFLEMGSIVALISQDESLKLDFKVCCARVFAYSRRLLKAASIYYDISLLGGQGFGNNEKSHEQALTMAVTCTILADAGSKRSATLAKLYKDKRCLELSVWPILQKVHLERILRKPEVDAFVEELKSRDLELFLRKAKPTSNFTTWDLVVIEHNILSASKVYKNISFDGLSTLLGITPQEAEKRAAKMIRKGKIKGLIDQVDAVIHFEDDAEETQLQDQQISDLCQSLDDILGMIGNKGSSIPI